MSEHKEEGRLCSLLWWFNEKMLVTTSILQYFSYIPYRMIMMNVAFPVIATPSVLWHIMLCGR